MNDSETEDKTIEDTAEQAHQYVTFALARESFALPMQSVLEIVRYPEPVHVPLTHPCLLGVANLRGSVVPIIDLRGLLGLEQKPLNDASRLLVIALQGAQLGLVVDHVERVMELNPEHIEPPGNLSTLVSNEVLNGVYQTEQGGVIQLLELTSLLEKEFSQALLKASTSKAAGVLNVHTGSVQQEEEEVLTQLVSFLIDEQEFAFRLTDVQEILRIPSKINELPNSPPQVLGLINLRQSTFPLLSMQALFGLHSQKSNSEEQMLIVLRRGKEKVALVVDQVREVVRLHEHQLEAAPAVLASLSNMQDVEAVCRLDQGERLIMLLQVNQLFHVADIHTPELRLDVSNTEINMQADELTAGLEEDEDDCQLVVFTLDQALYGLFIEQVQEITRLPEQLYPVPKCPDFIDGMMNLRGTVLPVMDMRSRLGLVRAPSSERQRILVLKMNGLLTGFVVDAVNEVKRLKRQQVEIAPALSDEQERLLGQVVRLTAEKQLIQLVNCEELISHQEQQALVQTAEVQATDAAGGIV
ncbi:MAG: chemotaxis protein CheW [Marinospirillum sp.]|uniref:chemotaxis protein CheW n=1 Tax=Marinospirillum sp. TaxID=2183934 RepID=UPI0019FCD051|nr:chemotaxis protein CheW [Marinospirillum sp.]MBE0505178.1 chemotaxis protein CheW [Marinospirillum sp.]